MGALRPLEAREEFLEPALEIEAIPQDELRTLGTHDILRCWLIIMDFRAGLGDALDDRGIARDILRNVLNDRESGRDLELRGTLRSERNRDG
jgi:hypothetical protein